MEDSQDIKEWKSNSPDEETSGDLSQKTKKNTGSNLKKRKTTFVWKDKIPVARLFCRKPNTVEV